MSLKRLLAFCSLYKYAYTTGKSSRFKNRIFKVKPIDQYFVERWIKTFQLIFRFFGRRDFILYILQTSENSRRKKCSKVPVAVAGNRKPGLFQFMCKLCFCIPPVMVINGIMLAP